MNLSLSGLCGVDQRVMSDERQHENIREREERERAGGSRGSGEGG